MTVLERIRTTSVESRFFRNGKPARPICRVRKFLTPHVFLAKSGAVGVLIETRGLDDETLTAKRCEAISRRLQVANRRWDHRYRIYRYMRIRQDVPLSLVPEDYEADYLKDAARFQYNQIHRQDAARTVDSWLVVLLEGEKAPRTLTKQALSNHFRSANILYAQARAYCEELADLIRPEILAEGDAFKKFYWMATGRDVHTSRKSFGERFDFDAANAQMRWQGDRLRLDHRNLFSFVMKEEPTGTFPHVFGELLKLRGVDGLFWQEWRAQKNVDVRSEAEQHVEYVDSFEMQRPVAGIMDEERAGASHRQNKAAKLKIDQVQNVGVQISLKGKYFGRFTFGGFLYGGNDGRDTSRFDEAFSQIERIFSAQEAVISQEVDGVQAAYRAMNMDPKWNFRNNKLIQNDHFSDLDITAFAPYLGEQYDASLLDEPLTLLPSRSGYPYSLTAFIEKVMGHMILGPQRKGKSFFVNWLLMQLSKYSALRFVFDMGESYNYTTKMCGGDVAYINGKGGVRLNPLKASFGEEFRKEEFEFHVEWLRNCFLLLKFPLEKGHEEAIRFAVTEMYEFPAERRRLSNLGLPGTMKTFLMENWSVFDTLEDSVAINDFQTFVFQFGNDAGTLREQFLALVLHRVNAIIRNPANRNRLKVVVFEELWHMLTNDTLADMVLATLKDGPKWFAGTMLISQTFQDMGKYDWIIKALCRHFHFFPDPEFDRKLYADVFRFTLAELDTMDSLVGREFMTKVIGRPSKVLRFDMPKDNDFYWWFTSDPPEVHLRDTLVKQYGHDEAFRLLRTQHDELLKAARKDQLKAIRKSA